MIIYAQQQHNSVTKELEEGGYNVQYELEQHQSEAFDIIVVANVSETYYRALMRVTEVPLRFVYRETSEPLVAKVVEFLTTDGTELLQTAVTDATGRVVFKGVAHGDYIVKVTY